MTKTVTQFREEAVDREAIRDAILRYARSMDRCDLELLRTVFWEDAEADYQGFYSGPIEEFMTRSIDNNKALDRTAHITSNILIEIDGDSANVETYVQAYHRIPAPTGPIDMILGARYLDRFEKRQDIWKIAQRTLIADWFRQFPDSGDFSNGPLGMALAFGSRFPEDPSYDFVGKVADAVP